mmetsp:Transcript_18627/g.27208  ORF Transcript_18627/g.27208 Transcript_18627/m.27208 type:complete len:356 (-) Transcript_18627:344-1411(-)|eukprot:CAMPEP_0197236342 /NCGR_PEP_ID=MMETSP1429-20130617/3473_1 /TAXON_ID=49237 /ORGANISM="Chaetoceros  sp., Strain UNC1202" /LENGTH=355 /DNA_ID=CAMNT_0042695101 /DNA_START=109 /DNA_END=1176 /DNA_ORIENTATION=-
MNPHSITHTASLAGAAGENGKKPGPLAKIRRRLTVTGATSTIDGGVSKLTVSGVSDPNIHHAKATCAITGYSGVSKKGLAPYNPKKKNQDALIMTEDASTNTIILCVLDGHGEHGDAVAIAFQSQLANEMMGHPMWKTDLKQASAESIAKIERAVIRDYNVDTEFSGTTLSMAIIRGNKITGVNIGDSRVIIGKQVAETGGVDLEAEEFTHDHKPDTPLERQRILAAGGRVFAVKYDDGIDGPPRVWLGHMDVPGLAMSRSLGDSVAHTAGVSSEPEFFERELDPATDKCIVVATDGLWEFVSNEETINMVKAAPTAVSSVETLVREANARWMDEEQVIDDTTVITATLFGYMDS